VAARRVVVAGLFREQASNVNKFSLLLAGSDGECALCMLLRGGGGNKAVLLPCARMQCVIVKIHDR
jgi:hypothetical protein